MLKVKSAVKLLFAYLSNVLVSVDQVINALFFGDPDETISSRAGKARRLGSFKWMLIAEVLDWLCFVFERDHCRKSMERDRDKRRYLR